TVNVTSLDVTAKSNTRYLLIGKEDNAIDKSTSSTTITFDPPEDNTVYPCSMWNYTDPLVYNGTTINFQEFYTATVTDRDNPKSDYVSVTPITFGDPNYFIHYRAYFTFAKNSLPLENSSFYFQALYEANNDKAISCALAVSWLPEHTFINTPVGTKYDVAPKTNGRRGYEQSVGKFSLSDSTSQYVDFYFFIDGATDNIYSSYSAPLIGSIAFKFWINGGYVR
nr:hypothetical protein [Bacilli bacterium]